MDQEPPIISHIEGWDAPELVTAFLQVCLFKLGGQVSFTLEEMSTVITDFDNTRIVLDKPNAAITLTMRTREGRVL
jgi:hypothetical protein